MELLTHLDDGIFNFPIPSVLKNWIKVSERAPLR